MEFFNARTGKSVSIVSAMPKPPLPRSPLHLDPHFSPQGTYIIMMTTVRGMIDVALTEVAPLLDRSQ